MRVELDSVLACFDRASEEQAASWLAELRFLAKEDVLHKPFSVWMGVGDFEPWRWLLSEDWEGHTQARLLSIPPKDQIRRVQDIPIRTVGLQALFRAGYRDSEGMLRVQRPVTRLKVYASILAPKTTTITVLEDFFFTPTERARIRGGLRDRINELGNERKRRRRSVKPI